MRLAATYPIPAPPARVFAALTDPAVLQRCIEGCERIEKTGEDAYDVHLHVGVAGLKGRYVGKVRLTDLEAPHSFTLNAEGKAAQGFVKGTARMRLVEAGGGTDLHCDADGQIGGAIAAVGSRLADAAASKLMDRFFRSLAAEFSRAEVAAPAAIPATEIVDTRLPFPPPLIYACAVLAGWLLHRWRPVPIVVHPSIAESLGTVLALIAGLVILVSLREFRRSGTSVRPDRRSAVVVRTGPFRYSRNPMYVSFAILQLAIACWINSVWIAALLLPALVAMSVVIVREERYLEALFGDTYREYTRAVRRWI